MRFDRNSFYICPVDPKKLEAVNKECRTNFHVTWDRNHRYQISKFNLDVCHNALLDLSLQHSVSFLDADS